MPLCWRIFHQRDGLPFDRAIIAARISRDNFRSGDCASASFLIDGLPRDRLPCVYHVRVSTGELIAHSPFVHPANFVIHRVQLFSRGLISSIALPRIRSVGAVATCCANTFLVRTERPPAMRAFTFSASPVALGLHDSRLATAWRTSSFWYMRRWLSVIALNQANVSVERGKSCGLPVRARSDNTCLAALLKGGAESLSDVVMVAFRSE